MNRWVIKGLRTGIVTTDYPSKEENAPGTSPGLPKTAPCSGVDGEQLTLRCPGNAIRFSENQVTVERGRCIHCYRCMRGIANPLPWDPGFEWAESSDLSSGLTMAFRKSLHIRVLDSGDCGACLNEVKLLNNPFYNMHRLGFFITPTPRTADILLVVGPVADHMKSALLKAYDAMPAPKRVMAVGACAMTGGIFENSFMTCGRLSGILPVDIEVPGCPPPPLAVLHGLLVLAGRKPAVKSRESHLPRERKEGETK